MNEQQQEEYDFFLRMAALAQQKVMELAPLRDDPIFRQYLDDMERCQLWARRIKEGWRMVKDGQE